MTSQPEPARRPPLSRRWTALIIAAVAVLLVVVVVAKTQTSQSADAGPAASPTAQQVDAVAAFEQAQGQGRPIYLLFHSLTCEPCVEISANVDQVIGSYADDITFVNAITDDPSAQQLAGRFNFQYIPTSFFIKEDGTIVDSYTGVLSPAEIRARLDQLAGS